MTQDIDRDPGLEQALREIVRDPARTAPAWPALREGIARRAGPELARRRWRDRRGRLLLPAALVASIALLVVTARMPQETRADNPFDEDSSAATGQTTVEQLLDADVSDRQFRALLFGATEADALLLIAAEEDLR